MEVYASSQALVFLAALLSGAVCGTVYDLLKFLRKHLHFNTAAVFFFDILFWIASACIVLAATAASADGEIRGFQIIGSALGAAVYFAAFSKPFERLLTAISRLIGFLLKILAVPVAIVVRLLKIILLKAETRCGKAGLIIMFYHRKFRKNVRLLKKFGKST